MIRLLRPSTRELLKLLDELEGEALSYREVGATRDWDLVGLSSHYNVDRTVAELGAGHAVFARAREALLRWQSFELGWVRAVAESGVGVGRLAAVSARACGLWWINVSRVLYLIDEPDRVAFAYGTLEHHAERGEERFEVLLDQASGRVLYRIVAFSRPRHLMARLGYPLSRLVQRRFARDSVVAMRRAVSE